ncbi:hypothetical protein WA026_001174 [Henosepilachna vigintioctopunctata]|uniref:Uncharacterized protein n=1 Tax=Henosepilachna vigintioctopunctata TaxID=420089 RepID=A0AAW1UH37_9CUCU
MPRLRNSKRNDATFKTVTSSSARRKQPYTIWRLKLPIVLCPYNSNKAFPVIRKSVELRSAGYTNAINENVSNTIRCPQSFMCREMYTVPRKIAWNIERLKC